MEVKALVNDYELAMPYYKFRLSEFLGSMQKKKAEEEAYLATKKLWSGFKI